jgi:hypothetical protein
MSTFYTAPTTTPETPEKLVRTGYGNNYGSTLSNKVGGLTKAHNIISIRERRDRTEQHFFAISFRANRDERRETSNQDKRNKRAQWAKK